MRVLDVVEVLGVLEFPAHLQGQEEERESLGRARGVAEAWGEARVAVRR